MIFLAAFITGLVMKSYGYDAGNIIVGISVLFMAFILMPVFIFYRYQKGKYKKYEEFFKDVQLIWDNCKTYNI